MAEEEALVDSSSGDSTGACSADFDSLEALYSDKVRLPVPQAPLFDNLSKLESVLLRGLGRGKPLASEGGGQEPPLRRFLPHQEPVAATRSVQREQRYQEKNVISRMQKSLGPLAALYEYMERRIRVKVYTRGASGLRGHVEAYVAAFDRHWNLALEDCSEVWSRRAKSKVAVHEGEPWSSRGQRRGGRAETLERHVPQLLLRGEQVALIARL